MSCLVERLQAAVLVLVGDGPVKERLAEAYERHLKGIEAEELPPEMRTRFLELREHLHARRPVNGESPVRASTRKMSVAEADRQAASIVGLLSSALRAPSAASRLSVVPNGAPAPAPAFLIDQG